MPRSSKPCSAGRGLAESLVDSAVALDFPLLAALAVGAAALVLIGSALSDAAAVWIDPG